MVAFGYLVGCRILRPLAGAVDALRRVAQRDYTVDVPVRGKDEIGQMSAALSNAVAAQSANAINQSIERVAATAAQTAGGAPSTRQAAAELSSVAADLNGVVSRFRV